MTPRRALAIFLASLLTAASATAAPKRAKEPAVTLEEVDAAYAAYNFEEAEHLLSRYAAQRSADIEALDTEPDGTDRVDLYRNRILTARNMMERVEKIVVIDSLCVNADDFFSALRLSAHAGQLLDESRLPRAARGNRLATSPIYRTPNGDRLLWAATDEDNPDGNFAIYQSMTLADGSLEETVSLFDHASVFGNGKAGELITPFLMPDGMTLYFAADGDASIGGLDIFVARATSDGGFLQPANVGMPYNSPANDYMMAIDEATGLGWWVTDRNSPDDMVTIYVFVPSDMRVNYPPDLPDLASYARLDNIKDTQSGIADVKERLRILDDATVMKALSANEPPFRLALPDGNVLTSLTDFRNSNARLMMTRWLKDKRDFDDDSAELEALRRRYSAGEHGLAAEIRSLEQRVERQRQELKALRNELITAEMP